MAPLHVATPTVKRELPINTILLPFELEKVRVAGSFPWPPGVGNGDPVGQVEGDS